VAFVGIEHGARRTAVVARDYFNAGFEASLNANKERNMSAMLVAPVLMAAAGYSLIYLLLGGGLGGAILIFIVAKMLGK
jgi:hypothetical protein